MGIRSAVAERSILFIGGPHEHRHQGDSRHRESEQNPSGHQQSALESTTGGATISRASAAANQSES